MYVIKMKEKIDKKERDEYPEVMMIIIIIVIITKNLYTKIKQKF